MKRLVIASAALALSAAAATPASAATIIVTVEGTVETGYDDYNTLGLGTDLTGQAVSMVFTFDDQTPGANLDSTQVAGQYLWGYGPDYGAGYDFSPGSAVVTIGGVERLVGGDNSSTYRTSYPPELDGWDYVQAEAYDTRYLYDGDGNTTNQSSAQAWGLAQGLDMLSSSSLYQNLDIQPGSDLSLSGLFHFWSWDYEKNVYHENIFGALDPNDMTFKATTLDGPLGAVPEPATWALMLLGFGLVASVMRRQRPEPRIRYS